MVRATVDKNLKSLSFVKNLGFMKEYTDLILEMKYDLNLDSFVRKNIDSIPVRFSKISKFIMLLLMHQIFYPKKFLNLYTNFIFF